MSPRANGRMLPVDEALARGRAFRLCLLLTLAVCPAAGAHADAWPARVDYVVDGDSLWVRPVDADGAATGPRARLRLVDIDAPEICQSGGLQAHDVRALVQGRLVQVAVRTRPLRARAGGRDPGGRPGGRGGGAGAPGPGLERRLRLATQPLCRVER